jgi:Tfp pilus assembly PilM family ATPase
MFAKSNDHIAISLSDDFVRVVEVKGNGTAAKITRASSRDIKGLTDSDLPKVIHSALNGFNTKASSVYYVIPANITTTKNIEIPSTNPEEIKSIVSLQAGRHTPFSREEIQISYINLGVFKANYTKVLLVIANKGVLKKHLETLEKSGVKVKKILFAPEGISQFYSTVLSVADSARVIGIIDVGSHSTDFMFSMNGRTLTSRNISIGKSHLTAEGPAGNARLIDELKKTLDAYQSEDIDQAPASYILTTDDAHTKSLQADTKEKLGWDVRVIPYIDGVKTSPDALKKMSAEYSGSSFLDIISCAVSVNSLQVNLVPEELELRKSIEDQGKEIFKFAILGFICLVLFACTLGIKIYYQNEILDHLRSKYKGSHEQVVDLENRSMNAMVMQNFLSDRMMSLDVINELYRNIPDQIYLTSVVMNEDGTVLVQGVSEVPSLIYNLGVTLKESALFKSVDITSTSSKKDRGKDVSVFDITLKLHKAEETEDKDKKEPAGKS